jgi:hypothetical protein
MELHRILIFKGEVMLSDQGPPLPSLIPSFVVDYNVKKANGERTDNGRKKMPR